MDSPVFYKHIMYLYTYITFSLGLFSGGNSGGVMTDGILKYSILMFLSHDRFHIFQRLYIEPDINM